LINDIVYSPTADTESVFRSHSYKLLEMRVTEIQPL